MTSEPAYIRDENALTSAAGPEEVMMMHLENDRYYALKDTAARLWELLETPKTEAQLQHDLQREYDVSESDCRAAVRAFLDELLGEKLVRIAE